MMKNNEMVLITGAGSGIGRELTRLFLAGGSQVFAVSLLQDELDVLQREMDPAGGRLTTLSMDLSLPGAAEKLFAHCESHRIEVDVLVNNAGFACFGDAIDIDMRKQQAMIGLNVVTLTETSMLFGRKMKDRRAGSILNVGSTAGMMPSMRMAAYCGSKSYVNTFSFALRAELAPYNVNVTCLTPAAVATNFAKTAEIDTFKGASKLKDIFAQGKASSPVDIARAAYDGLRAGKAQVLAGNSAWVVGLLFRLLPQSRIPFVMKGI
jgi:short-subunit dehydrogenase